MTMLGVVRHLDGRKRRKRLLDLFLATIHSMRRSGFPVISLSVPVIYEI
jgi:hypothetical protein